MSGEKDHPRRLGRAVCTAALATLAVLALAELGSSTLSRYLPEPKLWGDDATAVKIAQMDLRSNRCTDVVVAGNSMARDAFLPKTFEASDPEHRMAYNASLDAASPPMLRRWLTEEVLPRLHPTTVVLALASLDVNGNSRAGRAAHEKYDDAPLSRPGRAGRLEAATVRRSSLLRHRSELRQPQVLWEALARASRGEGIPSATDSGVLGPDGEGRSRQALRYNGNPASGAFLSDQLLNDFEIDGALIDAEADLVDELESQGISVVLVVLPVTANYRDSHPGGQSQFEAFLVGARRMAAEHDAPLIELQDGADLGRFADTHHLNREGAEALSRTLPALLRDNGIPARRC